jgi:hypothetical protein
MIFSFYYCKHYGIPLCPHTLNVPSYNKYWLEGGLVKTETYSKNYVLLTV